ncbi:AraC family transcriptional regulator, partial [Klebsiella quasipneumoniae subsp. similipneumoniae]|nr:AraC family transcriptional regulator [Klebsiella quasipneumoniae subsp. similipneumoniae]
ALVLSWKPLPVVEIAGSVVYVSESCFYEAFVREFGCTPG